MKIKQLLIITSIMTFSVVNAIIREPLKPILNGLATLDCRRDINGYSRINEACNKNCTKECEILNKNILAAIKHYEKTKRIASQEIILNDATNPSAKAVLTKQLDQLKKEHPDNGKNFLSTLTPEQLAELENAKETLLKKLLPIDINSEAVAIDKILNNN